MDQATQQRAASLQALYDRSARVQSAWIARPASDHPARQAWDAKFWSDLAALKASIRKVEGCGQVLVPPFVLSFLVEHNAAYIARRPYNISGLDPARAPRADGDMIVDPSYRFEPVHGGWWEGPEFAPPVPAEPGHPSTIPGPTKSSLRRAPESTGLARNMAPPPAPAPETTPSQSAAIDPTSHTPAHASGGRVTRSASRATEEVAAVSGPSPAAAPSTHGPSADGAIGCRKKAPTPARAKPSVRHDGKDPAPQSTPGVIRPKADVAVSRASADATNGNVAVRARPKVAKRANSSGPAAQDPGPFPETFEFNGQDLVDHWVPMKIVCTECARKGLVCRVNFLHGAQCNHCTNVKGHCSLVPAHDKGMAWTKEQRVYILYDFQRRGNPSAPHPATSVGKSPTFTVPEWFTGKLESLGRSMWAPGGAARMQKPRSTQSKRATFLAPIPDHEVPTARPRTPSLPPPNRTKTGPGKRSKLRAVSKAKRRSQSVASTTTVESDDDDDDGKSSESGHDDLGSKEDDSQSDKGTTSSNDGSQEGADTDTTSVKPGPGQLAPCDSAPGLLTRSRSCRGLSVSEHAQDAPDADMAEAHGAVLSVQGNMGRKRTRDESKTDDDEDRMSPAPAQPQPKRRRQQDRRAMTVPPPTVAWRDMPSLEKKLGLREQLSVLSTACTTPSPSDNEASADYGFAPDYAFDFNYEHSILGIREVDKHMTRQQADRYINLNFKYVEGETSSLWDALTKLEKTRESGQQTWERAFGEVQARTLQAIADNVGLSQRLDNAVQELKEQKEDIAQLRAVNPALSIADEPYSLQPAPTLDIPASPVHTTADIRPTPGSLPGGVSQPDTSAIPPSAPSSMGEQSVTVVGEALDADMAREPAESLVRTSATVDVDSRLPLSPALSEHHTPLSASLFIPRGLFDDVPPQVPTASTSGASDRHTVTDEEATDDLGQSAWADETVLSTAIEVDAARVQGVQLSASDQNVRLTTARVHGAEDGGQTVARAGHVENDGTEAVRACKESGTGPPGQSTVALAEGREEDGEASMDLGE
ncbi:hypothetical protein K466DRAFT_569330 [Polyporus arcularius HHB13444]|uniref:Uncharacterized protein n=1 Tax=Polyporus arcularius HHB13444 TaxID=1314778 RepID=A0A5C3NXB1_9APHY|nr:hypothetical protein K466DRAFT_569330 [Polyporus arcularius HHB13444]